jgi:hypothetical protein
MGYASYTAGTTIRLKFLFTDVDDNYVDPDEVRAYVMDANEKVTEYVFGEALNFEKLAVGQYALRLQTKITDPAGTWRYGGRGIGTYDAAEIDGAFLLEDWIFD